MFSAANCTAIFRTLTAAIFIAAVAACSGSAAPPPDTQNNAALVVSVADEDRDAVAGQTATLHAFAINAEAASFLWTQISGTKVTLQNATSPNLSFVAPTPSGNVSELIAFKLTVTKGSETAITKTNVTIHPVANVVVKALTSATNALAGNTVSLHAAGSGATQPRYSWTQLSPATPVVTLNNANTANPSFIAPNVDATSFRFEVRYSDSATGRSASSKTAVQVSKVPTQVTTAPLTLASSGLAPPQALSLLAPADTSLVSGMSANLAMGISGGKQPYTWRWTQTTGTPLSISGQNSELLTVTAPAVTSAETLSFVATVTDADGASKSGMARVRLLPPPTIVTNPQPKPKVFAQPQIVAQTGVPTTFTTTLINPVITQTGGSVATISATTAATGSTSGTTTVSVTMPTITTSTEQAQVTVTGLDQFGKVVQQIVPVLVIQTPDKAPALVAPPIVAPIIAPPLLSATVFIPSPGVIPGGVPVAVPSRVPPVIAPAQLTVTSPHLLEPLTVASCGTSRADEGQRGVVLGVCPIGGNGNYSYSWKLISASGVSLPFTGETTSHVHFNVSGVTGNTILRFTATVTDGQQTVTVPVFLAVNDLSATLNLGALSTMTVESGHSVALSPPAAKGGVPPYVFAVTQKAGVNVGDVKGSNPVFTAPTLAAGAADATLSFEYTLTDRAQNKLTVTQDVVVKAPPPPLAATLSGPSTADQGTSISLNTNVNGGKGPYTYAYTVSGGSLTIPATANPSVTLPAIAQGGPQQDLRITLAVTDSSTPVQTVAAGTLSLTVRPPQAPPPGQVPSRPAAGQTLTVAQTQTQAAQAGAALAALPASDQSAVKGLSQSIFSDPTQVQLLKDLLANTPPGQAAQLVSPAVAAARAAVAATGCDIGDRTDDAYGGGLAGGECATDFPGVCDVCYVAQVCTLTCGYAGTAISAERMAILNAGMQCFSIADAAASRACLRAVYPDYDVQ